MIDLQAEERRLEILEILHARRAVLVEQIKQATEFLAEADKQIAEFEQAALVPKLGQNPTGQCAAYAATSTSKNGLGD